MKSLFIAALLSISTSLTADPMMEDTLLYHMANDKYSQADNITLERKKDFIQLFNLTSAALFDGLLVNGSVTGLGTDTPVGKSMEAESLYYQMTRIITVFDWDFQRQYQQMPKTQLPGHLTALLGRLPNKVASNFPEESSEDWQKIKSTMNLALKDFDQLTLRESPAPLISSTSNSRSTNMDLTPSLAKAIFRGAENKLQIIKDVAESNQEGDSKTKLRGLATAITPLITVFEANYQEPSPFMRATAYLPPLYQLESPDDLDPMTWYLRPGMDKTAIKPNPVDISIGRLTHLSYLRYQDNYPDSIRPMIRVSVLKDLTNEPALFITTSFGRLSQQGDHKPFSFDHPEDGFVVHWHPNLPDEIITQGLASELRQIKVEASIQRLNLLLHRRSPITATNAANPPLLEPKYLSKTFMDKRYPDLSPHMEGSIVHFRAKRQFNKAHKVGPVNGKLFYQGLGFQCKELGEIIACELNMTTDDTQGDSIFDRVRNFASKHFTRFVVGLIIPDIEDALDKHLAVILDEAIDNMDDTKTKVLEAIRLKLFTNGSKP